MEDPITGDYPSRNILPEEEEFAIERNLKSHYCTQPTFESKSGECFSEGCKLVILIGDAACSMKSILDVGPVGTLSVPEVSTVAHTNEGVLRVHRCDVYTGGDGMIVISMERVLPQEQAMSWSTFVLNSWKPSQVTVVTAIPKWQWIGDNGENEDHVYMMGTSSVDQPCPQLPTGTMISGVAAAIMQRCDVEHISVAFLVGIQITQCPRHELVISMGEALVKHVNGSTLTKDHKNDIIQVIDNKYQSSANSSVYV